MDYKSQIMRVIVNHPGATRSYIEKHCGGKYQAPQRIACMRCLHLASFVARSQ